LEPTTEAGKLFTILFAIYGVIILGVFIGVFGNFISHAQTQAMKKFRKNHQARMLDTLFGPPPRPSSKCGGDAIVISVEETGFWRDHISLADDIWGVVQSEFASILTVAGLAIVLGYREGWGLTSTLYFSIMAATTTGYGDYTPATQIDKLYSILFLPLAVVSLVTP
jgi:potassium channel subfamily K